MKVIYSLLLSIFFFVLTTACTHTDPAPTKQELLSKQWKVGKVIIDGIEDQSTNYSGYRYDFSNNGTYTFTESNGTVKQGTWKFSSNEQKLTLDEAMPEVQIVQILVLNETTLELEFTIPANYKFAEKKMTVRLSK